MSDFCKSISATSNEVFLRALEILNKDETDYFQFCTYDVLVTQNNDMTQQPNGLLKVHYVWANSHAFLPALEEKDTFKVHLKSSSHNDLLDKQFLL